MKIHKNFFSNFRSILFLFFSFWIIVSTLLSSFPFFLSPVLAASQPLSDPTNYNFAFYEEGASDCLAMAGIEYTYLDNDSLVDLIVEANHADHNGSNSGSLFIILGKTLQAKSQLPGNRLSLGNSSNYDLRIDGNLSDLQGGARAADIDGDSLNDILISNVRADTNGTDSGALYIILNPLLNTRISNPPGANKSMILSQQANYSIRIDGPGSSMNLATMNNCVNDMNLDQGGRNDIMIGTYKSSYNGTQSGSLYLITDDIIDSMLTNPNTKNFPLSTISNYTIRYDGPSDSSFFTYASVFCPDFSGDSHPDLIIGAGTYDSNGIADAGSLFGITNELINQQIDAVSQSFALSDSNNYSIRYDGAETGDQMGYNASVAAQDLDGNGEPDLILSAGLSDYNVANSGSMYILSDSLVATQLTGLNKEYRMNNSQNYNLRIDASLASDWTRLGYTGGYTQEFVDFNGDGTLDIPITADQADFSGVSAGAVYILDNNDITPYFDTPGNLINVEDSYIVRYDGAVAGDNLGYGGPGFVDLNGDNRPDVILPAVYADYNAINGTGAFYIIYNFPHDLTLNTVPEPESNNNTPSITGSVVATNSVTDIAMVQYSVDDNSFDGDWQNCSADDGTFGSKEEDYTCNIATLSDGEHTIYIRSYDENISYTAQANYGSTTFIVDATAPTGLISINSGEVYTSSQEVGLDIIASDVILAHFGRDSSIGMPFENLEMMLCNEETYTGCSWENYDTSRSWILTEGDGTKTVYAKFKDRLENESETVTDTIILDTTGPAGSISINSGEEITNTDEVTLTLSATDNLTEVKKMMVSNKGDYSGGTWETYNTSKEWRLSMGDGEKRVYVKYRDEVGNISSSNSDSIEMDMGAPTGTLIINEGEEYTSSREVVLHITGEDEVTGVEEMRISEDRTMEGVEWEGYETSREYTLSEGDGYKVIYIQYRDGIGNESEVYGSNITLDRNTEIDITEIGEEEVEGEITEWETEETTPTFTGEGEVGATITIEIEGIETGTVIVNEDGVWSWTPSIELTRGQEYNVTITSTDLAGNEDIQTFILGISDEEVINVDQTTPESQTTTTQLPNTGVMLMIGLMLMGGLFWTGMNFKVIEKLKRGN